MPYTNSNATQNLISNTLQRRLSKDIFLDNIVNRDLAEGDITGPEDSVKLITARAASVVDWENDPLTFETYNVDSQTMEMDHRKAFAFVMDGAQNVKRYLDPATNNTFDDVLQEAQRRILAEADPANTGNATAGDITFTQGTDDVQTKIADAAVALDENGVSPEGRFIVLPSGVIREIEDVIAQRETVRGDEAIRVGYRGMFRGFEIYAASTQYFPTDGTSNPVALYGSKNRLGYADAVVNVQVIDPLPRYPGGVGVQGLHVAGAKTAKPEAFGRFVIT